MHNDKYCPNGNSWEKLNTFIYACDCPKCGFAVYELCPKNVTEELSEGDFEGAKKALRLVEVKNSIDWENMEEVSKLLKK